MNKILKRLSIILIISIVLIMITRVSYCVGFTFNPIPSASEVNPGDTVKINLKISDIDAGELGINTFQCVFKYDEDIFEKPEITSKNNWSITYNDKESSEKYGTMLAVIVAPGVKTDQEIGEISLKVKSSAKGKEGNITFSEVTTNDGKENIIDTNKTLNISVKGEGATINNGVVDTNTYTPGRIDNDATPKIPTTGLNRIIGIIAISIGIIAAVFAYRSYKKYKNIK